MNIHILTDSTADIPPEQAQQLGISVVPLTVFFGEEAYLDGIELDNEQFYAKLKESKTSPRTSQPSPAAFEAAYRQAIKQGAEAIISVHVSSKLSGTYQSACTARAAVLDDVKHVSIEMIDSETVSMGIGMSAIRAAEQARAGLGLAEIKAELIDRLSRTRILFVLDTLEYLKRGGRVGGAKALLGSMLSIKPILSFKNGLIIPVEQPRTRTKAYARIAQLTQGLGKLEQITLVESEAEVGQQLSQALKQSYPSPLPTYKLGAVVGAYAGPGAGGVACIIAS